MRQTRFIEYDANVVDLWVMTVKDMTYLAMVDMELPSISTVAKYVLFHTVFQQPLLSVVVLPTDNGGC